jgi:hypothetical protein
MCERIAVQGNDGVAVCGSRVVIDADGKRQSHLPGHPATAHFYAGGLTYSWPRFRRLDEVIGSLPPEIKIKKVYLAYRPLARIRRQ